MSQSRRRTVEQDRAKYAAECVNEAKRNGGKEYSSYSRRAGALIQTQGLGQALAFWYSKGWDKGRPKQGDAYALLYQHMSSWLNQQLRTNKDILQWITQDASTEDYRRATAEAQAFLIWLKRFAEAELGDDDNG
jgi:CRISPR-associated protein Cmr5